MKIGTASLSIRARLLLGVCGMLVPLASAGIFALTVHHASVTNLDRVATQLLADTLDVGNLRESTEEAAMAIDDSMEQDPDAGDLEVIEELLDDIDASYANVRMRLHAGELALIDDAATRWAVATARTQPFLEGSQRCQDCDEEEAFEASSQEVQTVLGRLERSSASRFGAELGDAKRDERAAWSATITGLIIGVGFAIFAALWLARSLLLPLRRLRSGVERIAVGDLSSRVPPGGAPELAQLADALNDMAGRLGETQQQLVHQAYHDPLTGLPNRTLFRDRVDHAVNRRVEDGRLLAVLYLDLDHFKHVNDGLGHEAGDSLLVQVAGRLAGSLRPADTPARLGGDEFAVLLEDLHNVEDSVKSAERVLQALRPPFMIGSTSVPVTASIGIAIANAPTHTAEKLLRDADIAMFEAKSHGRGGYRLFEPTMHAGAIRRLQQEADLRTAVERQQLVLYYQPVIDLLTNGVVGAEALLRWSHPERGLLLPAEFITLAETSGLIVPIGRWVLREACRQAKVWETERRSDKPLRMSVNVSAIQLREVDFVEHVTAALDESGLDPALLTVEITESALLDETETVLGQLRSIRALGVRLSVDDFGTGFSSLSYLRHYPIDELKVDRSFITGIETSRAGSALLRAILDLSSALELETVAEGIETAAQLERLQSYGCPRAQGYFFAPPLDAAAFVDFLGVSALAARA